MTPAEYWRSGAGLAHITPPGNPSPEGAGFGGVLAVLVDGAAVLEVGCGVGRLAGFFPPERYRGIDICPEAIARASAAAPGWRFALDDGGEFPEADVTLLHTVLLHVADDELAGMIRRLSSPRVLVSEILGRRWRRSGNPPVFNRDARDYEIAFAPRYRLLGTVRHPYPHYRDTELSIMEFVRC